MKSKFIYRTSLIILLVLNLGCGRKTAPEAPEVRAAKAVTEYQLKGIAKGVLLSWLAPSENLKGDEILAFEGFTIKRREYEIAGENEFEVIANITPKSNSNSYSYLDSKAVAGKTYDYLVSAINDEGVEGAMDVIGRVVYHGEDSKVSITPYIIKEE